jgi:hypothetical protein
MSLPLYENILKQYLQSKIVVKHNNKSLRTGKLTLYNIKQYFIKLYIETEKKEIKTLELPYPYKIHYYDNSCVFNYHLSSICNNHLQTMNLLQSLCSEGTDKLYNNTLEITRVD